MWCGQPEEEGESSSHQVSVMGHPIHTAGGILMQVEVLPPNPIPKKEDKWAFKTEPSQCSYGLDSPHPIPKSLAYGLCF